MTPDILVKFQNHPPLQIVLKNVPAASLYRDLVKKNQSQSAMFRDPCKYTLDHFAGLILEAKQKLGWDWLNEDYNDINTTMRLHKDIERMVGGADGYHSIPDGLDELLHELHFCIHAIQGGSRRSSWLQIEWFNDDGVALPDDFEFAMQLEFGDVKLQNPYVGHAPILVWEQNDRTNISMTCKFHDLIRPGINLVISSHRPSEFDRDQYIQWFKQNDPAFVEQHGAEKILRFTGWPVIGKVANLDVLEQVLKDNSLEIESVLTLDLGVANPSVRPAAGHAP